MAHICTVIATSHSPFLYQPLEWWRGVRRSRPLHASVPVDSDQTCADKHLRVQVAMKKLRRVFEDSRPDVVVIFGDDQKELFSFSNMPAFALFAGDAFGGYRTIAYEGAPEGHAHRPLKPKTSEHWVDVPAQSALSAHILQHLMAHDFDPAYMLTLPDSSHGMGHAFMRPMFTLTGNRFHLPVVPIMVNCFYAPQPKAQRCLQLAQAVKHAIESWPSDCRVAVIGSGGLWHLPGADNAYMDTGFDETVLSFIQQGKVHELAQFFDGWTPSLNHADTDHDRVFSGGTGMRAGIGSGSGETRTWIMAAGVANRNATVIDYIPIHASPCGAAFAHWDMG